MRQAHSRAGRRGACFLNSPLLTACWKTCTVHANRVQAEIVALHAAVTSAVEAAAAAAPVPAGASSDAIQLKILDARMRAVALELLRVSAFGNEVQGIHNTPDALQGGFFYHAGGSICRRFAFLFKLEDGTLIRILPPFGTNGDSVHDAARIALRILDAMRDAVKEGAEHHADFATKHKDLAKMYEWHGESGKGKEQTTRLAGYLEMWKRFVDHVLRGANHRPSDLVRKGLACQDFAVTHTIPKLWTGKDAKEWDHMLPPPA